MSSSSSNPDSTIHIDLPRRGGPWKRRAAIQSGIAAALAVFLLAAALMTEAFGQTAGRPAAPPDSGASAADADAAARRLAGSLVFRTIASYDDPHHNAAEFRAFHAYLEKNFPRVHAGLKREIVGGYSLLFRWEGSDPALKPALWMAHSDVVPVSPGTDQDWAEEPFAGLVKDGFIWGRGAWDNKGNLMAQLETVESLLASGFQPARTLYLAFGHDEEVTGPRGNQAIAALMKARGIHFDYVIDEGLVVTQGIIAGFTKPVALVGVAEKGYVTLKLEVKAPGGHSSMPPRETAVSRLAAAVNRVAQSPMPARIDGAAGGMFAALAPESGIARRMILSNLWLTGPLVRAQLEKSPTTDAMMRTTIAATVIQGGDKENVLPGRAHALLNMRLLPGDSVEDAVRHVTQAIADPGVAVSVQPGHSPASKVSSPASPAFHAIGASVKQAFPDALVAPGLVMGGTDARHYEAVADNIYRFSPVRVGREDTERIHGTNERLSVANYAEMMVFYRQLATRTLGAPKNG